MSDPSDTPPADRQASRYASRKFLLTTGVLIASVGLLLHGKIDAPTWLEITRWIMGIYCAANVGTVAADLIKGRAP